MRVFVTRRIPDAGMAILRAAELDVVIGQADDDAGLDAEALRRGVLDCDVLLSLLTEQITSDLLGAARPRLRGVANMAVGYDNVDVAAARRFGIPVSNTPGVLTDATADLTWALLLGLARRVVEGHEYTVAGRFERWGPNLLVGADVGPTADGEPRVLGIVGLGRIGRAVARRAIGFDLEVLAYHPSRTGVEDGPPRVRYVGLDELLTRSDFVSLHVPLNDATRHLIGAPELASMKSTAFLINTSRGPVVDEAALVAALRAGDIAGAGLDVYEREPSLAPGLVDAPNVVLLPHIASASGSTRAKMASIAATNAVCFARGDAAPNVVNGPFASSSA